MLQNHQETQVVSPSKARITAIGTYIPSRILNNSELEQMVDTSDEWILKRTGIRERRITRPDEFTSHICISAIENLQQRYSVSLEDVDFIIVCTATPDHAFPSVSSQIQAYFGIENTGAIDLNAVCAGFVYGLHMANSLITSGLHRKVLVIGADTFSKTLDYTDRTTCILFGDGAGAVLVEYDEQKPSFIAAHVGTKGEGGAHLYRSGLSNKIGDLELLGDGNVVQNGREVYKWAVSTVPVGMDVLLDKSALSLEQLDWFIPHSANMRIIESICERSGFPLEKTLSSVEYCGNTSAASIPLALDLGVREGKVTNGDTLLLYGFGGGLVHAGVLLNWNVE